MSKNKTFKDLVDNDPAVKLDRILTKIDNCYKMERELSLIKHHIASNTLTNELYKFLDENQEMRELFKDIEVLDTSSMSQEALDEYKLVRMRACDAAIEGIISKINAFIVSLWHAFLDWLDDWFDDNKRLHFRLKQHLRHITDDPMDYGSDQQFNELVGFCYIYKTEWIPMKDAIEALSKLFETVSSNDPYNWLKSNVSKLTANFAELGYEVTDTTIRYDNPKYVRNERAFGTSGAGWSKPIFMSAITKTINMLEIERGSRQAFLSIRRTFDKVVRAEASDEDKKAMVKLVRGCKAIKTSASIISRTVCDIGNRALAAYSKH